MNINLMIKFSIKKKGIDPRLDIHKNLSIRPAFEYLLGGVKHLLDESLGLDEGGSILFLVPCLPILRSI